MDKRESDNIKRLAIVLAFVLIIITLLIIFILITHKESDDIPDSNNIVNNIVNNTTILDHNEINGTQNIDTTNSNNSTNNDNQSNNNINKLRKITDMESYFWLKDRLYSYYSLNDFDDPMNLMDRDVIDELELTNENYREFNDFDGPTFRIDEIYEQILDNNKILYVVKHKYGKDEQDVKDSLLIHKTDMNNETFSIYPYEYLRTKNYTDFKEGDIVTIDDKKSIVENDGNKYTEDDDDIDVETCMKGLFERFKFDLLLDNNHLYSILEVNYKDTKYSTLEELKQYIKNNKTDLYLDMLSEYKVINYNDYVEYRAICNSQRNYVFNVKNMMDYTISLDNYSIVQNKDTYNAFLPVAQAKYCVDRVVQALNYKDYNFVYSKLNPVQKNNYYKNIEDFKDFISKNSYQENKYEIDNEYLILSDSVYQFKVKITDATAKDFSYMKYTMTVTLKDNEDFFISIVNGEK